MHLLSPIDSICTSYALILTPMHPYVLLCPLLCPIVYPYASVHHHCTLCFLCTPMSLCTSYKLPIHPLCPHLCTLCTPMHHYELAMLLSYTPHAPYASPMPTICPPVHSHAPVLTLCASYLPYLSPMCCDMTFWADSRQIPILEHLDIIKVLMHANATIMFIDYRCSL